MSSRPSQTLSLYTLSPLHCGTGVAAGAIDLPVVRDPLTRNPIIPGTALKGVIASHFRLKKEVGPWVDDAFGRPTSHKDGTSPGSLVFTDAAAVLFPVPAIGQPIVWITCPLVLERLDRSRRAFGATPLTGDLLAIYASLNKGQKVWVSGERLSQGPLVLEDRAWAQSDLVFEQKLRAVVSQLVSWLLPTEKATGDRVIEGVALVDDVTYMDLVSRCTTVSPRVKLTSAKTTGRSGGERGNLWFEETVPPDTLFVASVSNRIGLEDDKVKELANRLGAITVLQVGGDETVGHGLCLTGMGSATAGSTGKPAPAGRPDDRPARPNMPNTKGRR